MDEGLSSRRRAVRSALALGGAIALAFAIVTLLARSTSDPSHAGGSDALLETGRGLPSAAPSAAKSPADAGSWAALRQEDLRTPGVPRAETEEEAVTARRRQMLVLGKYYLPAWWMRKASDTDKFYPFLTADGGKGFAPGKSRFEVLDEVDGDLSGVTRGTCTDAAMCVKKEGDPCAPPDAVMITPDFACHNGKVVPFTSAGSPPASPAKPPSTPEAKNPVSPYRPSPDAETQGTCVYNCEKQPGDVCVKQDASVIPQAYACVDGFVGRAPFRSAAQSARTRGTTALAEEDAAPKDESKPDPGQKKEESKPDAESAKKDTAPDVKVVDKYAPTYGQPVSPGQGFGPVYPNAGGFTLPPGEGCPMSWEQVKNGAKSFPGCPPIPPMPMCPFVCKPADASFEAPEGAAPCPYPCLAYDESQEFIAQRTPIAVPDKAETGPLNGPNHDKGEQGAIAETAYTAADGNLPIPGTGFLGYGFDGKKDCLFEECATLPIIKWTYEQDKVIVTPAGSYKVPDQMRVINQYDTTGRTDVYSDFSQVEEALVTEASISGASVAFSGSASASYSSSSSSEKEKWYSTRKMDVKLYSLQVRVSNIEESTNFDFYDEVRRLPLRFLDNPRKFLHFIQKWGPYVVLDATFGGTLELTLVTEKTSDISAEDIAAAVEAEYNGIMASGSVSASFASSEKNKRVSETSQTAIHSNGGDPAVARVITDIRPGIEKPMFRGDFESWLNSVPHFPRAINKIPMLTEIYKLVPGTDDESVSRRNALQMACAVYVGDSTASTSSLECVPEQGSSEPTTTAPGGSEASKTTQTTTEASKTTQTTKIGDIAVTWANYNRITINECIRFAARGAGEVDVVFASVISKEDTWTRVRITHEGAYIYEGSTVKASTTQSAAAAMGSDVIFEDYWICIFPDTISYGKGSDEYITWKKGSPIIKPRFYGFGCSTPTSFASVQIVNPDCKWMGSDTVPFLIEPPKDDPVQILPITDTELKAQGEGIQDNDCHKWMCRTTLDAGAQVVKQNDAEWYPAKIYTSKQLACDISHLRSLDPSSNTVSALVEVSHFKFKFDSKDPENLALDKKYGYNIQLKRCPGGADADGRWIDCHNEGTCRDAGGGLLWECSCQDPWGGNTCNECNKVCPKSFPTADCDGCKDCAGFLEAPQCTCTDKSKTKISEQCLEVDSSCAFCQKCTKGYLGNRCELKYEWVVGDWTSCPANENGHMCGSSTKTRSVYCKQVSPFKQVSDSLCVNAGLGNKETTSTTCTHAAKCLYEWIEQKDWKPAGGQYPDCGYYDEYQTVVCVASWATSTKVSDKFCTKSKPFSGPRRVFKGYCGKTALDYKPQREYFSSKQNQCITGNTAPRHFISIGGERSWPTGGGREDKGLQTFLWPRSGSGVDTQQVQACDTRKEQTFAYGVSVQSLGDCKVVLSTRFTTTEVAQCPAGYTIISGGCQSPREIGQAWADIGSNRFVCGIFERRDVNDPRRKNDWITSEAMCCKTDKIRQGCQWVQANNNWVREKYEVRATCPPGYYLYGGSCNTDSGIGSFWPFVGIGPGSDGRNWMCKTMDPTAIAANAYCCPQSGVVPDFVI